MARESISVASIVVGERHRALSNDAVKRIAASLEAIGLRSPVTVRVVDDYVLPDGEVCDGVPLLVAGAHRLAAAKYLGWSHIDCVDANDDALSAEMWEIAENLHRLDLTKEQRDEHIRRYAELLAAQKLQQPQTAALESKRSDGRGHQPKGIARQIADATGLSDDTVRRALNPKPAAEVIPISARSEQDAILAQANAIVSAWNRACPEARSIAMEQIDGPVFDRSAASR